MRVYLVPAEEGAADLTLRYAETIAQSDGAFKFAGVAPGRYHLVARPLDEEESLEAESKPIFWEAGGRAGLRFEGEALGNAVELRGCQRATGYVLRYVPPIKPRPKKAN
jgi:hypothetical protein